MTVYHCPKCDITFRHEDAEAVFCPKCQTTLCDKTSENDGVAMPENYQYNTIPVGLVVAFVVIACNLFIVVFVGLFAWASMENHDARGFLLFVNSTVCSIPAIFCFIIYKDYWKILLLAVLVGTTAFFGPLLIARYIGW